MVKHVKAKLPLFPIMMMICMFTIYLCAMFFVYKRREMYRKVFREKKKQNVIKNQAMVALL
jgi:hypothetical protein